jgi:membrane fusion protein, macrolide-specific efflux system
MRRKILALAVLVAVGVAALGVSVGGFGAGTTTATEYLTSEATVGDVTDEVAATGGLAAATTYGLAFGSAPWLVAEGVDAPASDSTWPVTEVSVKPGDAVTAGQALATADTTEIKRAYDRATNDLRTANLQYRLAQEQVSDARDADDTDAERQALLQLYAARNQVSQATDARQALQAQLRAATITAPIDGIVTEVNVAAGFDAPSGPAIVVASRTLTVTTDVVESDLADVKVGQTASVTIDAIGATLDGTVTAISPVAGDSSSGVVSYPVTVTIEDTPADARPGMSADIAITIASATGVVTVPSSALQGTTGDYAVMTLGADGNPQRVAVDVGLVTNATAEIRSGLEAGTPVVIGTTADLIGTDDTGGRGFPGGVAVPGGVVRRIDGAGPNQERPVN